MNFNHQEEIFLSDISTILNTESVDQLTILKALTKLIFCIFNQISQIPLFFNKTNSNFDENIQKALYVFKTEITSLRENPYYEYNYSSNREQESAQTNNFSNIKYGGQPQNQDNNTSGLDIHNHLSAVQSSLQAQIARSKIDILKTLESNYLIRPIDYEPDIYKACEYGKTSSVRWLIEKEKQDKEKQYSDEINYEHEFYQNDTPIHIASKNGHLEIVKYLIENRKVNKEIKGWYGKTPLHYACEKGHQPIVEYLILQRANVNVKDDYGWTPLHYACATGQASIVEYLISKGANIEAMDDTFAGWTPLHLASLYGYADIIKFILSKNINKNIRDKNSQIPSDWAKNDEIKKLLQ